MALCLAKTPGARRAILIAVIRQLHEIRFVVQRTGGSRPQKPAGLLWFPLRRSNGWWCGRWELNPHGPCDPADFLTGYGFRRPDNAGLRSGLSLHLTPEHWRLGAARLVSTPS